MEHDSLLVMAITLMVQEFEHPFDEIVVF